MSMCVSVCVHAHQRPKLRWYWFGSFAVRTACLTTLSKCRVWVMSSTEATRGLRNRESRESSRYLIGTVVGLTLSLLHTSTMDPLQNLFFFLFFFLFPFSPFYWEEKKMSNFHFLSFSVTKRYMYKKYFCRVFRIKLTVFLLSLFCLKSLCLSYVQKGPWVLQDKVCSRLVMSSQVLTFPRETW